MKVRCGIIIFLFAIVLTLSFSLNAVAMTTGFEVNPVETDNNIGIKIENKEYHSVSIKCFDVSDTGLIAIGTDEGSEKHVNLYDNNGTFKYGYSFTDYGTYGVGFDDENILIYISRGETVYLVDRQGNCLEKCDIINNIENNSYWNNVVFAKTKESSGNKYYLSKSPGLLGMVSPFYSRLIKKELNGEETILLDVSNEHDVYITSLIIVSIIVISISIVVVKNFGQKINLHFDKKY